MKYTGLTKKQAKELLDSYGYNELKESGKKTVFNILWRQIQSNFIVYLLLAAMIISFIVGKDITAYTILAVITIVIFSGFFQEYKAEEAVENLKKMVMPVSLVIREGRELEIETKEIVPGDIVVLRTGEKIPADCVILECRELEVNESVLTGESKEVAKIAAVNSENYDDSNSLFAGSFIVNGKGIAKVVHTGMNTRFGKIAGLISSTDKELPLQKKVNRIAKFMALVGVIMASATGLTMLFSQEITPELLVEVLILTIAISVSAFPEGFPVVLITTLSVGAFKMAKKNAIVNRMSIIETLGETTVICSDKTGTITKGEMTVKKIYAAGKRYELSGVGYDEKGDFHVKGKKIEAKSEDVLSLLLKVAVLCNDAVIMRADDGLGYTASGSPTEAALLVMAAKGGFFREDFFGERQEEITFNSERKMMSVLFAGDNETLVCAKGAPETIIKKCRSVQKGVGVRQLSTKDRLTILAEHRKMTEEACRTIAFAYRKAENSDKKSLDEELVFLGLAAMEDPPREEVAESLRICENAGITVKMITGDNKETAMSIAGQIGLDKGRVVEGEELDELTDDELTAIVGKISIFARVRPVHKIRIVKALKERGEIVTMTGDGVNDSPALKEAHIGVAMGRTGTDVSRSVADLILKDDNFATIVAAIREGRAIFNNIRKFTSYQLSCNYAELFILFIGALLYPYFGWPVPILLALHILFMNLITDNLPAITLGFNNSSQDIMEEKPRRNAKILVKSTVIPLIISGIIMAAFSLVAFWVSYNIMGMTVSESRTITLVILILLEIAGAFSFRSFRKPVFGRSLLVNKYLVYASGASLLATLVIVYSPLNKIFETSPLLIGEWLAALAVALAAVLIMDLLKTINNKKKYLVFD
ncbi:MAG TPA: cation-transporting P-type ATPase [bacterium]|nr:cation-transporting P-type ATPase [bacterium]